MLKKCLYLIGAGAVALALTGCSEQIAPTSISQEEAVEQSGAEASVYTSTAYDVRSFIYGDVNGDGRVMANDYALIRDYVLKRLPDFPSNMGRLAADVSGDGKIMANDYALARDYVLKRVEIFPGALRKAQECLYILDYLKDPYWIEGEYNDPTSIAIYEFQEWCERKLSTISYAERPSWEHLSGIHPGWTLDQKTLNALRIEASRKGSKTIDAVRVRDGGGLAYVRESCYYIPGITPINKEEYGYIRASRALLDWRDITLHLNKVAFDKYGSQIRQIEGGLFVLMYIALTINEVSGLLQGDTQAWYEKAVTDQFDEYDLLSIFKTWNLINFCTQLSNNKFPDGSSEVKITFMKCSEERVINGQKSTYYYYSLAPWAYASGNLKIDWNTLAVTLFDGFKLDVKTMEDVMMLIGEK